MHRTTARHTLRRALAATACSAALLTLAACGGDDEPSADPTTSAEAEESPTDASDEATDAATDTATEGESPSVDAETNSEVGERVLASITEGKTAHVEMVIEAQGQSMTSEGDVDFTTDPMSMSLVMSGGPTGSVEMIMVGGTMYMKAPDTQGKYLALDGEQAGSMFGFDPQQMLSELEGFEGGDKVDDDHYRYEVQGTTADIYFEGDRLSRMVTEGAGIGSVTITYSDWGKDVNIVAPPAAQVEQMPGM